MKQSTDFEKMIARLHGQLEPAGSLVTWNDRIIDPDNPDQTRQIDISIKNQGKVTHVECRIHKAKQDVKWIEELEGRRRSLHIDTIIAVSASGFTRGALIKAHRFGINTMMLEDLSFERLCALSGDTITVILTHYTFLRLDVTLHIASNAPESEASIVAQVKSNGVENAVLKAIQESLDSQELQEEVVYSAQFALANSIVLANGSTIERILVSYSVQISEVMHTVPLVKEYSLLTANGRDPLAVVESVHGFEVIKSAKGATFTITPSEVALPENTMLGNQPMIDVGSIYTLNEICLVEKPIDVRVPILKYTVVWKPFAGTRGVD
jgi:hypothetical protein